MRWVSAGIVITFMVTGCSDRESSAPTGSSKTQSSWEPSSLGQVSAASPGFDSPQATFDAIKAAAVNNDVAGAIRCMSSRSRKMMAEIMMLPLTMIATLDPKKEKEVTAMKSIHVERVVTADGESLVHSHRGISWFSKNATALNREFTIGLRNLLRSVTEIDEVELQLLITLPTQVKILWFDPVTAGTQDYAVPFDTPVCISSPALRRIFGTHLRQLKQTTGHSRSVRFHHG